MKNVAVLTEDGAFAVFFCPHPGGFDSLRVPTPRNLPSIAKKMPVLGGQPRGRGGGGWAQVELADALDPSQIKPPILSLYLVVPFFFFDPLLFFVFFFFFIRASFKPASMNWAPLTKDCSI